MAATAVLPVSAPGSSLGAKTSDATTSTTRRTASPNLAVLHNSKTLSTTMRRATAAPTATARQTSDGDGGAAQGPKPIEQSTRSLKTQPQQATKGVYVATPSLDSNASRPQTNANSRNTVARNGDTKRNGLSRTSSSSSSSVATADLKGKTVAATSANGFADDDSNEEDEDRRKRAVDKILKRTEAAKVARNFRTRIALASFKTQRGWHNADFESIETHLDQSNSLHGVQQTQTQSLEPSPSTFMHASTYQDQQMMPPPQQPSSSSIVYGSTVPPPFSPVYTHHDANVHSTPHSVIYSAHTTPQMPYASTSTAPFSAPPARPSFMLPGYGQALHSEQQPRQKRRMTVSDANGRHIEVGSSVESASWSASPNRRHSASIGASASGSRPRATSLSQNRSNEHAQGQQVPSTSRPLSSSDPTFSSFVDAAAALTGLSRGPSDPNVLSGEDDAAAKSLISATPGRPSTPERDKKRAAGAVGESSAEGAAELMLFLAASPSPVQTNRASTTSATQLGGESAPVKGRRLFSGVEGTDNGRVQAPQSSPSSAFGGNTLTTSMSGTPINLTSAPNGSSPGLNRSPFATEDADGPSKTSMHYGAVSLSALGSASSSLSNPPATANSTLSSLPPMPSTPGRDRQMSNGGGGWEHFLNVSPSPQRPTFDRNVLEARGAIGGEAGTPTFSRQLNLDRGADQQDGTKLSVSASPFSSTASHNAPFATTSITGALEPTPAVVTSAASLS
ncbi:hypothetical protein OIO90_003381 [Microbotryomycetes sp. JL221]|nr:hypothetical protein OIO90_003381 [Microbotryomycetes sp. JL221]